MNKSIKIKIDPNAQTNQYVKVKLEQDTDTLEILSVKLGQNEIYASFNSDYGVLIGRVIANGGIGVPNAKIAIFIPITVDDQLRSEIQAIYPYTSPRDMDQIGRKYNLLPRVSVNNPFISATQYAPVVPLGSFPTKEEIYTNSTILEVYEKYYKYTTVTNNSGDYMIYGVPVGQHDIHCSVDITDIGKYSMSPGAMITNLGYSPNLFDANGTKVKFTTDLDTTSNVELQNVSVDVRPFWGDKDNFEVGITRQDFKIRATLISTFTLFGSAFTDGSNSSWGKGSNGGSGSENLYRITNDGNINVSISSKRNGLIHEQIFYLPNTISDVDIIAGNYDPEDFKLLDPSQYTAYVENGQFVYLIACNRRKIVTNDDGTETVVANDDSRGVFTEFKGFATFRYGGLDQNSAELPITDNAGDFQSKSPNYNRMRLKIPQSATLGHSFGSNEFATDTIAWKKQIFTFSASNYYSVAKRHATYFRDNGPGSDSINTFPDSTGHDPFNSTGVIAVSNTGTFPDTNADFQFPSNSPLSQYFGGGEWMNFNLHFPQFVNYATASPKISLGLVLSDGETFFIRDNTQLIAANVKNTIYFGRSDLHQTDFIKVPKEDILNIINQTNAGASPKGFRNNQSPYITNPLIGVYKSTGAVKYFYKGLGEADSFIFLRKLNLA